MYRESQHYLAVIRFPTLWGLLFRAVRWWRVVGSSVLVPPGSWLRPLRPTSLKHCFHSQCHQNHEFSDTARPASAPISLKHPRPKLTRAHLKESCSTCRGNVLTKVLFVHELLGKVFPQDQAYTADLCFMRLDIRYDAWQCCTTDTAETCRTS